MSQKRDKCGICLDIIILKKHKCQMCCQCKKLVHHQCWLKWRKQSGACVYCKYQIDRRIKNKIFTEEEDMERDLLRIIEIDDDHDEWLPTYNTRIPRHRNIPQLRPRVTSSSCPN